MLTILPVLPIAGFAGCSLAAAVSDVHTLRIPNGMSAAILILFGIHALISLNFAETVTALALAGVILLIGFGAYLRGWLGGGDAKFLAACMAWAGASFAGEFIIVTALSGGGLALVLRSDLTSHFADRFRRNWPGTVAEGRVSMPYGVAIATGAIAVVLDLLS